MQGKLLTTYQKVWESTIEFLVEESDLWPPEPVLTDYYHPSENQKKEETAFIVFGTGLVFYIAWRYL